MSSSSSDDNSDFWSDDDCDPLVGGKRDRKGKEKKSGKEAKEDDEKKKKTTPVSDESESSSSSEEDEPLRKKQKTKAVSVKEADDDDKGFDLGDDDAKDEAEDEEEEDDDEDDTARLEREEMERRIRIDERDDRDPEDVEAGEDAEHRLALRQAFDGASSADAATAQSLYVILNSGPTASSVFDDVIAIYRYTLEETKGVDAKRILAPDDRFIFDTMQSPDWMVRFGKDTLLWPPFFVEDPKHRTSDAKLDGGVFPGAALDAKDPAQRMSEVFGLLFASVAALWKNEQHATTRKQDFIQVLSGLADPGVAIYKRADGATDSARPFEKGSGVPKALLETAKIGLAMPATAYQALLLLCFAPSAVYLRPKTSAKADNVPMFDSNVKLGQDLKWLAEQLNQDDGKSTVFERLRMALFDRPSDQDTDDKKRIAAQFRDEVTNFLVKRAQTDIWPQFVKAMSVGGQSAKPEYGNFLVQVAVAMRQAASRLHTIRLQFTKAQMPLQDWPIFRFLQMASVRPGAVDAKQKDGVVKCLRAYLNLQGSDDYDGDAKMQAGDQFDVKLLVDRIKAVSAVSLKQIVRPSDVLQVARPDSTRDVSAAVTFLSTVEESAEAYRLPGRAAERLSAKQQLESGPLFGGYPKGQHGCTASDVIYGSLCGMGWLSALFDSGGVDDGLFNPRVEMHLDLPTGPSSTTAVATIRDPILVAQCHYAQLLYESKDSQDAKSLAFCVRSAQSKGEGVVGYLADKLGLVSSKTERGVSLQAWLRFGMLLDHRVAALLAALTQTPLNTVRVDSAFLGGDLRNLVNRKLDDLEEAQRRAESAQKKRYGGMAALTPEDRELYVDLWRARQETLTKDDVVVIQRATELFIGASEQSGVGTAGQVFAKFVTDRINTPLAARAVLAMMHGFTVVLGTAAEKRTAKEAAALLAESAKRNKGPAAGASSSAPVAADSQTMREFDILTAAGLKAAASLAEAIAGDDNERRKLVRSIVAGLKENLLYQAGRRNRVVPKNVAGPGKWDSALHGFVLGPLINRTWELLKQTSRVIKDVNQNRMLPIADAYGVPLALRECSRVTAKYLNQLLGTAVRYGRQHQLFNFPRMDGGTWTSYWGNRFTCWLPSDHLVYRTVATKLAASHKFWEASLPLPTQTTTTTTAFLETVLLRVPVYTHLPLRTTKAGRSQWDDRFMFPPDLDVMCRAVSVEFAKIAKKLAPPDTAGAGSGSAVETKRPAPVHPIAAEVSANAVYIGQFEAQAAERYALVDRLQKAEQARRDIPQTKGARSSKALGEANASVNAAKEALRQFDSQVKEARRGFRNQLDGAVRTASGLAATSLNQSGRIRAVLHAYCVRQYLMAHVALGARRLYNQERVTRALASEQGSAKVFKPRQQLQVYEIAPSVAATDAKDEFDTVILNRLIASLKAVVDVDAFDKAGADVTFLRAVSQHMTIYTQGDAELFARTYLGAADAGDTVRAHVASIFARILTLQGEITAELEKSLSVATDPKLERSDLDYLLMSIDGFFFDKNKETGEGQGFRGVLWRLGSQDKMISAVSRVDTAQACISAGLLMLGQVIKGAGALTVMWNEDSLRSLKVACTAGTRKGATKDDIVKARGAVGAHLCRLFASEALLYRWDRSRPADVTNSEADAPPREEDTIASRWLGAIDIYNQDADPGGSLLEERETHKRSPIWFMEDEEGRRLQAPLLRASDGYKLFLPEGWDPNDLAGSIQRLIPETKTWDASQESKSSTTSRMDFLVSALVPSGSGSIGSFLQTEFISRSKEGQVNQENAKLSKQIKAATDAAVKAIDALFTDGPRDEDRLLARQTDLDAVIKRVVDVLVQINEHKKEWSEQADVPENAQRALWQAIERSDGGFYESDKEARQLIGEYAAWLADDGYRNLLEERDGLQGEIGELKIDGKSTDKLEARLEEIDEQLASPKRQLWELYQTRAGHPLRAHLLQSLGEFNAALKTAQDVKKQGEPLGRSAFTKLARRIFSAMRDFYNTNRGGKGKFDDYKTNKQLRDPRIESSIRQALRDAFDRIKFAGDEAWSIATAFVEKHPLDNQYDESTDAKTIERLYEKHVAFTTLEDGDIDKDEDGDGDIDKDEDGDTDMGTAPKSKPGNDSDDDENRPAGMGLPKFGTKGRKAIKPLTLSDLDDSE